MKHTILLIEDEQQQRDIVSAVLEGEGYDVLKAESAETALLHLNTTVPTVIIADVKLPGADGFTLFDVVRQTPRSSATPFIFITGYNEPRAIEEMMQKKGVAYLTKPYDLSRLIELVHEAVSSVLSRQ